MEQISFDFFHRVKYYETDQMGYVHNSNYFRFFEIGREETMRSLSITYKDVEEKGVMMPLIQQYAHYYTPALYDDVIIIRTIVKQIPTTRIHFDYEIFRKENNEKLSLICKGWNELCFVDKQSRKPMRCPIWLQEIFEKQLQ